MLVLSDAKKHSTRTWTYTHIPLQDPIQTDQFGSNILEFKGPDQMILETLIKVNGLCN